ncbi:MAG: DUF3467 domain-containing protein [Phycisphaeraceae bacterium]
MTDQNPTANATGDRPGKPMRVRIDDRSMTRTYANAFRTQTTPEEVFVDFGVNLVVPAPEHQGDTDHAEGHLLFQVDQRVILNYYTVKRLAITLGQVVRIHEERFGELKLDAAERARSTTSGQA